MTAPRRRYRPADMTEAQWQSRVMDTAKLYGWHIVHIRATEVGKGRWAVPYEGNSGLPDLVLARDGRSVLVELKSETGRLTLEQRAWLEKSGGFCWRPSMWEQVEHMLRTGDMGWDR